MNKPTDIGRLHISFAITAKICKGYEWVEERLQLLVDCIDHYCQLGNISYEILICEHLDEQNLRRLSLKGAHLRILDLPQTYPNPFEFNMIESYGKNRCLREACGKYTAMIGADQLFPKAFFDFIDSNLVPRTFYRFATYEVGLFPCASKTVTEILSFCRSHVLRLCNPGCFDPPLTPEKLGQKSGDIMLLDTMSFRSIGGWPENECFSHVDTATCFVASNLFDVVVPPPAICSYTFQQNPMMSYRPHSLRHRLRRRLLHQMNEADLESYQWTKCLSYRDKIQCNESF